ncbi:AsmA family protein [Paenochrobactrum pullorum]|uniref:AsmA family protein n=1 Tax=Paenochrobactrum pullorum TaxID=1324351 RepID=UPI0035BC11E8
MGRIFVIVGGFLVLLLTAALVIPPFINWTGYRADFEREASRIMGREVHVRGTANARLLPFPSVTFSDVLVGSKDDTTTLSIDKFSINAELMPFLRGEVLIFDMQVEKPVLKVALDEKGRVDWKWHEDALLGNAQVKVEKLTVSNGRVSITDGRNGRHHDLQNINAVLSARNITGPWQMNGSLESESEKFALDLSTGELKPDGSLRVRSRFTPENKAVSFETDGDVTLQDGLLNYAGNFNLRTPEPAKKKNLEKTDAKGDGKGDRVQETTNSLLTDLRIQGTFKASDQQFVIDEFRMEQGIADDPYVVNGKAQFNFGDDPRFEISADGQQFFFGGSAGEQSGEAVPLKEPLAAFRKFIGNIPVPSIPGSVDLRLPAIVAGGTTIRTITISAVPEGQGWQIKEFSADLPGRTRVEAQGHLGLGDQFGFEGNLLVASRQPSGLVGWLTADVDETVRQLSGIGLSGKVVLNDRIQQIDDLEIGLDDTSLTGSFYRRMLDGGVPSIDLDLHSKKISNAALQMMMSPLSSVEGITAFGNQALNVSLKADALVLGASATGALDTRFRFGNGRMDFDRFMLQDLNGATITAAGNFEPHQDELTGTVDATLLSDDLAGFISWLQQMMPDQPLVQALFKRSLAYPDLFSQSEINFIGSTVVPHIKQNADSKDQAPVSAGALNSETSFSVNGKAGRMQLDFSGTAGGQWNSDEGLQIQLNGRAKSEEGEQILALLGLPVLPLGLVGELEADVTLQGALNIGVRTQIQLQAPDAKAGFDGVVTVLADDVTASGKAHIKAENFEPFLASNGYSLPGFGLGLPVELVSDVQFAKGIIRLPNLQGSVSGNKISAKLEALKPENASALLRGEVEADDADLQFLSEIMLGTDAFTSRKNTWPQQKFLRVPMLPFSFDLRVKAAVADVGQYGVVKDFSAKIAKTDDQLELSDVQGNWQDGQVSGMAQLRNSEGNALFSGDMSWKGFDLTHVYQINSLKGDDAPLNGKTSLTAKLQGSGASVADVIKSLSGSAQLVVDGLIVPHLNAAHLPQMLEQADQNETVSQKNTTKRFEAIAAQATGEGVFEASNAQFDFMIAGGVARMGLTRLENSKGVLESDLQIDLSDMSLNGNSRFTYKFNDGAAMAGSYPAIGVLLSGTYSAPKITTDHQPLVQFLTQRALEREQERVEAMQSALREKQNLRREAERLKAQKEVRDRALAETEARNKAEAQKREQERLNQERLKRERLLKDERKALEKAQESEDAAPNNMESIGQSVEEFLKDLDAPR